MNLADNPTKSQLKEKVMQCNDDKTHHILWVDHQGNVNITPMPKNLTAAGFASTNKDKIKFRIETFARGNSYVGATAAGDDAWMKRLYDALVKLWDTGYTGYTDNF